MVVVQFLLSAVSYLLGIYLVVLWARFILDLVLIFAREWRPRSLGLVVAESVFTVTDPPLKLARRLLPPLRLGPAAIDFSLVIVMLAVVVLMTVVSAFGTAARL